MSEYQGSCMCGKVAFSFQGSPRFVADCVCESCRVAHGAPGVTWVGVNEDQFKLNHGEAHLRWYRSSNESERGFCNACGTRIFFRSSKWPGEIHMTLANLAEPHNLHSTLVSFEEEAPAWTLLRQEKR